MASAAASNGSGEGARLTSFIRGIQPSTWTATVSLPVAERERYSQMSLLSTGNAYACDPALLSPSFLPLPGRVVPREHFGSAEQDPVPGSAL